MSESLPLRRRGRRNRADETGASLIGLLLVVLILGLMAAVTLGSFGFTPNEAFTGIPSTMPGGGSVDATTTTVPAANNNRHAAAACRAGFEAVLAAVHRYESSRGSPPPSGRSWALDHHGGAPLLAAWPRDSGFFDIVWNGSTLSVIPTSGAPSHSSVGTKTPPTGCSGL